MVNLIKKTGGVSVKVRSLSYAPHNLTVSDLPILFIQSFFYDSQKKRCNSTEQ